MLKASTFNEMIRKEPERMDGIIRQYAGLIRQVYSVEMEPGELPSARDVFRKSFLISAP